MLNIRSVFACLALSIMGASALAQRSTPVQLLQPSGAALDQFGYAVAVDGDTMIVGALRDDVGANTDQGSAHVYRWTGSGWTFEATLTATGGATGDNFGISVALSGDTAIVGASGVDVGANSSQGSAYVFVRTGTTWTQQTRLNAAGGAGGDFFGFAVALSGDTALVGAYGDDVGANSNQGSAYVFTRSGTSWTQQSQLNATGGAAGDFFGVSVAISGDTAIVGALRDDVGANTDQGSAYIFTRSGTAWTEQAQLTATGGAEFDGFGTSVAISGDTAIVGAYGDDVGANSDQGSATVFVRPPGGTTWTQQAQLNATGGAADDVFGWSVAISGDTVVVGAYLDDVGANSDQGSAYVFTRSGSIWTQQAQLTATDGAASDRFGAAVAISGDTALMGADADDVDANANQGSAWVFSRIGSTWIGPDLQALASGGAAGDFFGDSVAISGDTAVVGAYLDNVGGNFFQGSAYIFVRAGGIWTQQAQLTATGGATGDRFGTAVAISGDTVVVGADADNVGGNFFQGSAYIFVRAGTIWTQQAQLTAADGAANDSFGGSGAVAISGGTAIVGAYADDVGANSNQGSAWFFDVAANDFSLAHNDVTDVSYPTLTAALLPAQSGQQITATEAAWRTLGSLDTAGRSLILWSDGDLRTPSTSVLTLGGSSSLNVDSGNSLEVYGQLRASGYTDLYADSFRLGSRGILTARTGSSLTINAPTAQLDGQTRLEQGASLTFLGSANAIGPTTANLNSSLTTGGTFTNIDTFTITAGTINAPLFYNRAQANIFGSSAIFGSYTNEAGATTTIRSGTLFVFGSLTNNGTIVGTLCSNCLATAPNLEIGGNLTLGPAANLNMPFADSRVSVGGSFNCAINSNTRFDMSLATLQLQGVGGAAVEQTLEVMSADIGRNVLGLDRSLEGHYPIGTLHIGPSASTVRLVDAHDNDGMGQDSCEAIYVDTLRIDAGSRLINTSCRIYYNTLINEGEVDVPTNLLSLTCPADIDGVPGLDFGDFLAFFNCFDASDACGDIDGVPGTDFGDFLAFFNSYDTGC
jgi:hypothetical protein